MMTFLTTLAPFDFRGDVDQMALLENAADAGVAAGPGRGAGAGADLHADPVGALAAMVGFSGRTRPAAVGGAAFAPLYNFVLFGIENLLFLLFPTRVMVTTPGDFQAMGRNVLAQFGKMLGVGGAASGRRVGRRASAYFSRTERLGGGGGGLGGGGAVRGGARPVDGHGRSSCL